MNRASWIVVILILVILGGVAVNAVKKSRHAADRAQCANGLKQVILAIHCYQDVNRRFPTASHSESKLPHAQRLSWMLEVYAYGESNMDPLWRTDPEQPWDAEKNRYVVRSKIAWFNCPVNPNEREAFWTSYVGITGVGKDPIDLERGHPAAGFIGFERAITLKDLRDGFSTTIFVAETNRENGPWAQSGHSTARGLDAAGSNYLGMEGQFGSQHQESKGFMAGSHYLTLVAFGDGTVRPLNDAIDPHVFEALATIAGGEKVEPLPEF
jgi:hypothetical protein